MHSTWHIVSSSKCQLPLPVPAGKTTIRAVSFQLVKGDNLTEVPALGPCPSGHSPRLWVVLQQGPCFCWGRASTPWLPGPHDVMLPFSVPRQSSFRVPLSPPHREPLTCPLSFRVQGGQPPVRASPGELPLPFLSGSESQGQSWALIWHSALRG